MKRSERAKEIRELLLEYSTNVLDAHVEKWLRADERAGVVWDPEEPELPAQLRAEHDTGGTGTYHSHLKPADRPAWRNEADRRAGYAEAVRRFNLVPELRKRITAHLLGGAEGGNCVQFTEKLLALIDNKEPT